MFILNNEDCVKSRKDGRHEVDILLAFGVIPSTKHAVGGSQNSTSRVQCSGDTSLQRGNQIMDTRDVQPVIYVHGLFSFVLLYIYLSS